MDGPGRNQAALQLSQHPDAEVPNDDSGAGPWPASRAWPLLPLERMVDDALVVAQQRGYFDDPDAAEPLRWLETCNEQVKDCMAALESMLDPHLDDLMSAALEEHQRGETVPLDTIL